MSTADALQSWGSFNRDDPFPLFAEVREMGPVHAITLADGHPAWLVVGYDEAKLLLNDTRLSKDMQAAFSSGEGVLAEGLPGPAFARHMLAVDPPDHTRLRRLVASAFSLRRIEALEPRIRQIIGELLDSLAAQGPEATVDLVPNFAFPLPFTVICELLGVPEPDREPFGNALIALLSPTDTPEQYAKAKVGSDAVVARLDSLVETKEREPGDDLVSALVQARDGDERLDHGELACHDRDHQERLARRVDLVGALALQQRLPHFLLVALTHCLDDGFDDEQILRRRHSRRRDERQCQERPADHDPLPRVSWKRSSMRSQICASSETPSKRLICCSPVDEVTLISVR